MGCRTPIPRSRRSWVGGALREDEEDEEYQDTEEDDVEYNEEVHPDELAELADDTPIMSNDENENPEEENKNMEIEEIEENFSKYYIS